jgi:hypothetical protein
MSADFMLIHQQLYSLHQLSLLIDPKGPPERSVVFTTVTTNNGHGNHDYNFEIKFKKIINK